MNTTKGRRRNGLTTTQIKHLRQLLLERRRDLRESFLSRSRQAQGERAGQWAGADREEVSQQQVVALRVMNKEGKLLQRVENALAKFDTGEYGLCEGTDELIGYPRLQVVPWARFSVAYKEERERERNRGSSSQKFARIAQ